MPSVPIATRPASRRRPRPTGRPTGEQQHQQTDYGPRSRAVYQQEHNDRIITSIRSRTKTKTHTTVSEYDRQQAALAARNAHRSYQLKVSNRSQRVQEGHHMPVPLRHESEQRAVGENKQNRLLNQNNYQQQQIVDHNKHQERRHVPYPQGDQQLQQQHQRNRNDNRGKISNEKGRETMASSPQSYYSDPEPFLPLEDPSISNSHQNQCQGQQYLKPQQQYYRQSPRALMREKGRDPPGTNITSDSVLQDHNDVYRHKQAHKGQYKHFRGSSKAEPATPTPSTMTDRSATTRTTAVSTTTSRGTSAGAIARQCSYEEEDEQRQRQWQRRKNGEIIEYGSHFDEQNTSSPPPIPEEGYLYSKAHGATLSQPNRPEQRSQQQKEASKPFGDASFEQDNGRGGSTASSGAPFRSKFFRAAALAAQRDGKIVVENGRGRSVKTGMPERKTPVPLTATQTVAAENIASTEPYPLASPAQKTSKASLLSPVNNGTKSHNESMRNDKSHEDSDASTPIQNHVSFKTPETVQDSPGAKFNSSSPQRSIRRTGSYSTAESTEKSSASIARLVARISSVNRDDPASALAAIDAILNSEGGSDQNVQNTIKNMNPLQEAAVDDQGFPAHTRTAPDPSGGFNAPEIFSGVDKTAQVNMQPRSEEEDLDSFFTTDSDEDDDDDDGSLASTVSSITNPTYLGSHYRLRQQQEPRPMQPQHQQQQPAMASIQEINRTVEEIPNTGFPTPQSSPGRGVLMTPPKLTRTGLINKQDGAGTTGGFDEGATSPPSSDYDLPNRTKPAFPDIPISPSESRTSPIARIREQELHLQFAQPKRNTTDDVADRSLEIFSDPGGHQGYKMDQISSGLNGSRNPNSNVCAVSSEIRSNDGAFERAAQHFVSKATPVFRSSPANSGRSTASKGRMPNWRPSQAHSADAIRSTPSRSIEDPYVDQSEIIAGAFAGVDISFEEDKVVDDEANEEDFVNYAVEGGTESEESTEDNQQIKRLNKKNLLIFDSTDNNFDNNDNNNDYSLGNGYGYSYGRRQMSDIGVSGYGRRDNVGKLSFRPPTATKTSTPKALQEMKRRFGVGAAASGFGSEGLNENVETKSDIITSQSDIFPERELEKERPLSNTLAERDRMLTEFRESLDKPKQKSKKGVNKFLSTKFSRLKKTNEVL